MKNSITKITLLLATSLGIISGAQASVPILATTETANLQVSAIVGSTCSISTNPVNFGSYLFGQDSTANGAVIVNCSNGTPYNIKLDKGANGSSVTSRQMVHESDTNVKLNYALFSDSNRTSNWGETIGYDTIAATAGASATTHNVYGIIPSGQNVLTGNFSDVVVVSLVY